jgi:hypothetical protein
MIDLSFLGNYAPVWLLIVLIVVIYAGLEMIKLPGSKFVLALVSVVISFMLVASTTITNFLISVLPYLAVILTLTFFTTLTLVFVAKDLEPFKKPLAWISFILVLVVFLTMAFHSFPALNNIFPNTSDSGLSEGAVQLKNFIYSQNFKDSIVFIGSLVLVCVFLLKKAGK